MKTLMKVITYLVLPVAILFLVYLIFESVMQPVRFNNEVEKRGAVAIERLKNIRTTGIGIQQHIIIFITSEGMLITSLVDKNDAPIVKGSAQRTTLKSMYLSLMNLAHEQDVPRQLCILLQAYAFCVGIPVRRYAGSAIIPPPPAIPSRIPAARSKGTR